MKPTPYVLAIVLLAASASPLLAQKGGFGGPIGPGSRDGLQPSVNDVPPNAYAYEQARPKMRVKKPKRK
jgi:hypothetical protein